MLILERPWTRQPQTAVGVDWSNPLARGLAALTGFGAGPVDAATSRILTPYGSIGRTVGRFGIGAEYSSANSAYERVADDISPQEITIFCLNTVLGAAVYSAGFAMLSSSGNSETAPWVTASIKANSSTPTGITFGHSFGGSYESIQTISGISTTAGQVEFIVARGRSGTQNLSYFINDALFATAAGTKSGTLTYSAGRRFIVGEDYRLASRNGNRRTYIAGLWTRYLSDGELVALRVNPWQLFAPRRIYIPTPAAAAAVPTLSASTYVPGSMTSTGWRPQITAS